MALVFHDVHGSNVRLANNNITATRIDKQDNSSGVLFSSRPLIAGETLEVRLDGVAPHIQGGGLEIGVTDRDPASLRSSMPRTATDLRNGRTVVVSGFIVALNGKEIDIVNHNVHDIQSGEKLALRLDSDEAVEILLFGECISRIKVSGWPQVYGVVDLFGKAEAVTITSAAMTMQTTSQLGEIKSAIKSMLSMMAQKKRDDLKTVLMKVKLVDESYHKFLKQRTSKQQAAGYMAKLKGGQVMTIYLKQLQKWGLEDKLTCTLYTDLRSVCWNYGDNSHELCKQFGEQGLLKLCTEELRTLGAVYKASESYALIVYTAFGIIHNSAKFEENRGILRRCGFVEAAKPYTDTAENAREIVLNAVMAISYVIEENETVIARLSEATMSAVLDRLRRAIDTDEHQYDGWHAYELCTGLANLAVVDSNLRNAVEQSAHGLFGRLLVKANDDQDRLAALHALSAHICPSSCRVIAEQKGMLELLQETKEKGSSAVKEKASDVYEKLTKLVQERKELKGAKPESGAAGRPQDMVQRVPAVEDLSSAANFLSVNPTPSLATSCPYRALCSTFFKSLDLNAEFFNPAFDMCYCRNCHRGRKDRDYYQRGSPPKLYGLPLGWCRFALLLPPRAKALDVSKTWHRAFHGTRHKFLGKILEVGELAVPGRDILGGDRVRELPGHFCDDYKPDGFDTKKIFLSPSIAYSGHDAYATPARWRYRSKTYHTRVAFQVFISPDSYAVGPETIGAKKQLDPKFSNREIEWFTSQQGSTILYGLLIKLQEV